MSATRQCAKCGFETPLGRLQRLEGKDYCGRCFASKIGVPYAEEPGLPDSPVTQAAIPHIPVTTAHRLEGHRIVETLDVITAECAFGMNVFRDIFAGFTDFFGGRSNATQNVLRDARVTALSELRREAVGLGANAVIGVDLAYSEMSGGGKSMLFLVASGTAVRVEPEQSPNGSA